MASRRRKSTDNVQRKAVRLEDAEIREISPQERQKQFLLNLGVWFLVIAFCMTSGIMCYAIGSNETQPDQVAQEAQSQKYEVDLEIERYTKEVGTDATNVEALANLGYYWMLKGQTLPTAQALKTEAAVKKNLAKEVEGQATPAPSATPAPQQTQEEAFANARDYLNKALALDKEYLFAKRTLADLEVQEDHLDKAQALYQEVVDFCKTPIKPGPGDDPTTLQAHRDSQRVEAQVKLASLLAQQSKFEEAQKNLDEVLKTDPGNIEAYHTKALVSLGQKDMEACHKALDMAILIAQNMNEIDRAVNLCFEQGAIYEQAGQKKEAVATFTKARDMIPAQMGGQAAQMRAAIQAMIDRLEGKTPAPKPASPAPVVEFKPQPAASSAPTAEVPATAASETPAAPATAAPAVEATPAAAAPEAPATPAAPPAAEATPAATATP